MMLKLLYIIAACHTRANRRGHDRIDLFNLSLNLISLNVNKIFQQTINIVKIISGL